MIQGEIMYSTKQIKLILFSLCFLNISILNQIFAEPKITELKGTADILRPEFQHLSPAHGCLWFKQPIDPSKKPIIQSMYHFGPQDEAPIKLLHELFFLNHDLVNFNPQQHPKRFATHLTPYDIGVIVGLLQTLKPLRYLDLQESIKHKKQLLQRKKKLELQIDTRKIPQKDFSRKKQQLEEKLKRLQEQKKTSKKQKKSLKKQQQIQKQIDFLESSQKLNPDQLDIDLAEIKSSLNSMEQNTSNRTSHKKKLYQKLKVQHPKQTDASLKKFVTIVVESRFVSNDKKFLKNTTINILLAFLWGKAHSKKDILSYFTGLSSVLNKQIFTPNYKNILDKKSKDQKQWFSERFDAENYEQITTYFSTNPIIALANLEQAVFLYHGLRLYEYKTPPIIKYHNDTIYETKRFPNCAETFALNLINIVIYNPKTQLLDISFLERVAKENNKQINQDLVDFYKEEKHKNPHNHDHLSIHDAWTKVVSKLPNVTYKNKDYEITASGDGRNGFKNMEQVIYALTGFKKIPDFFKALKKHGLSIEMNDKSYEEDTEEKSATFTFTLRRLTFQGKFTKNHFALECLTPPKKINQKTLDQIGSSLEIPLFLTWFSLYTHYDPDSTKEKYDKLLNKFKLSPIQKYYFYFYQNLFDPNIKTAIMQMLLEIESHLDIIYKLIAKLIRSFTPLSDTIYYVYFEPTNLIDKLISKITNPHIKNSIRHMLKTASPGSHHIPSLFKAFYTTGFFLDETIAISMKETRLLIPIIGFIETKKDTIFAKKLITHTKKTKKKFPTTQKYLEQKIQKIETELLQVPKTKNSTKSQ